MAVYEDLIKNDPRFDSVKRVSAMALLEPVTRTAINNITDDARALGIDLMVFETYRSQARQQELFNQGASKLRTVGVHHYGPACDLVKVVSGEPSWKGDFSFLGCVILELHSKSNVPILGAIVCLLEKNLVVDDYSGTFFLFEQGLGSLTQAG
jgi:hypothetical protein